MGFFIKQSEGGDRGPGTMKNSRKFMVLCMFWFWLLAETATVISNPLQENIVNFSRHIAVHTNHGQGNSM